MLMTRLFIQDKMIDYIHLQQLYKAEYNTFKKKVGKLQGMPNDAKVLFREALWVLSTLEKEVPQKVAKYEKGNANSLLLNICNYELLKSLNTDLALGHIEAVYKRELPAIQQLIKSITKERFGNQKHSRVVLKGALGEVFHRFQTTELPQFSYAFVPFSKYILSSTENYIISQNDNLSSLFLKNIEATVKSKIRHKEIDEIFQLAMIDLWEKVRTKSLKPRKSSLVAYVIGICKNKLKDATSYDIKKRIGNDGYEQYLHQLSLDIDTINLLEDIPDDVKKAVQDVFKGISNPKFLQLWLLKARGASNDKIMEILGYKTVDSIKTQWYKAKREIKKLFMQNPNLYDYLVVLDEILIAITSNNYDNSIKG